MTTPISRIEKLLILRKVVREYKKTKMMITDAELIQMAERMTPTQVWQRAFEIYNADKSNHRLSMNCKPCFNKVLAYLLKIRLDEYRAAALESMK